MARRRIRRRRPRRPRIQLRGRRGNLKINTRGIKRLAVAGIVCWGLWSILAFMYQNMYGVVMNFASNQAVNIATSAINEGIMRSEMGDVDPTQFITTTANGADPLVNHMLINNYRATISQEIVEILLHVQQGDLSALGLESLGEDGVLFEVPWAAAFNLTLFHNIGPRFPVRARMMGNVDTDVEIKIEDYGINNAVLTVSLIVRTDLQVALPFRSQVEPIETQIPMVTSVLRGDIPQFYWNSAGGDPAVVPPISVGN